MINYVLAKLLLKSKNIEIKINNKIIIKIIFPCLTFFVEKFNTINFILSMNILYSNNIFIIKIF